MQVVFVNRFFQPDHSATSQMLTDLATHLAARGWEVTVVTSRQRYEESRARLPARERLAGVDVERVWTSRFGRAVLPLRAIDYLTFYASAFVAIRRHRHALIVALTDPPLLSIVASLASSRTINWVQDLFPDVARALGMRVPRIVDKLRDWSFRRALVNVALGPKMATLIVGNTVVQHNWAGADLEFRPPSDDHPFTVAYSGNLGRAHEFETMLGAMQHLSTVRFVMTGSGALMSSLRSQAPANVEFHPYELRERLSAALSAADVHLVSLRPQLEGTIVPSKFYGILAVGRPVIFIGSPDGEIGRIVAQNDCGLVVEQGDSKTLAAAIERLSGNRQLRRSMGLRARALYEREFSPSIALARWERILHSCQ